MLSAVISPVISIPTTFSILDSRVVELPPMELNEQTNLQIVALSVDLNPNPNMVIASEVISINFYPGKFFCVRN